MPVSHELPAKPPILETCLETAKTAGVSPNTVRAWRKRGLPYVRVGKSRVMYSADAVKKWLESQLEAVAK